MDPWWHAQPVASCRYLAGSTFLFIISFLNKYLFQSLFLGNLALFSFPYCELLFFSFVRVCSFFNFCSLWSYIVKTEVRIGYCFTHAHFNQSILPSSRKISSCKGHRGSHIQKRVSLMFIYWEGWHLWKEHRDYYFQSKKSNSRIR